MTTRPMLQATDLYASYPGVAVLTGISLSISPGDQPVGIIGPSGSGKTTLIRALDGTISPFSGSVTFNGRPVAKARLGQKKHNRAALRRMSQDSLTVTNPQLTVKGMLGQALKEARKGGRTHATSIEELLHTVGMHNSYESRQMSTLSGGEKQRVALASALATRPDVLLLDEPLTAVDPHSRGEIARTLKELINELKIGVLIASHDLELVARLCPSVHVLADGQFVASGPLNEVLANPTHPVVQDLAEAAPLAVQRFR